MPKSLSELKSSPDVGLAEREVSICLSAKLVAQLEQIKADLADVQVEIEAARDEAADEDVPRRPRRMGEVGPIAELEERADRLAKDGDALRERILDNSVTVLLRGKPNGEWRQWAAKHPARDEEDDPQGAQRDRAWSGGFCNIDALVSDLGLFIGAYNGEDPSEEWAEFVAANGVPANLTLAASRVVGMHEQVMDAGKSLVAWRSGRMSASA